MKVYIKENLILHESKIWYCHCDMLVRLSYFDNCMCVGKVVF